MPKKNDFRALIEEFDLAEALGTAEFDDANGVIKNVVLLTGNKTSANKTHYTTEALTEAQTRYEGANMFIDHGEKGKNRSVRDFGGVYKNVRIDGNKLRGDVALRESARKDMMDIAKMRPAGIGLSIKDRGRGYEKDGIFYVQGFSPDTRYSVDFVVDPSVNRDLFESKSNDDEGGDDMEFKGLTLEVLSKERPDLLESIQNAGKAAILKELEESKGDVAKVTLSQNKLTALVDADFTKEVRESVSKMIMDNGISLDVAKNIIAGQKQLIETMTKGKGTTKGGSSSDPKVTGMGQAKEGVVTEGADELPGEVDILEAFGRR